MPIPRLEVFQVGPMKFFFAVVYQVWWAVCVMASKHISPATHATLPIDYRYTIYYVPASRQVAFTSGDSTIQEEYMYFFFIFTALRSPYA